MSPINSTVKADKIHLGFSNILTATEEVAIGTRIKPDYLTNFFAEVVFAISATLPGSGAMNPLPSIELAPGQWHLTLRDWTTDMVFGGVGFQTQNPDDYVLRTHRGRVGAFLRRELAQPVTGVGVIVYTRDAYLDDPDVLDNLDEFVRIDMCDPPVTHVLVAVLAYADAVAPPPSVSTFVRNLAGANNAMAPGTVTLEDVIAQAQAVQKYSEIWATVAD